MLYTTDDDSQPVKDTVDQAQSAQNVGQPQTGKEDISLRTKPTIIVMGEDAKKHETIVIKKEEKRKDDKK